MTQTHPRNYDEIDISSQDFWKQPRAARHAAFAELRAHRPVSWHRPAEGGLMPPTEGDEGFWAVARHADVTTVSRLPGVFCSGQGTQFEDPPQEVMEQIASILAMDAPRHTRLRRLVSATFTPRRMAIMGEQISRKASEVVTALHDHHEGDFVSAVARRVPTWTFSELMGVDEEEREAVARASDEMVGVNDPSFRGDRPPLEQMQLAAAALIGAANRLAEARRSKPADDLMTSLVQAEVDGYRLTDTEVAAFFVLLAVGGNDTSRNTISHGMKALTDFPQQRQRLAADLDGRMFGAVEECIRWATPIMTFRRTATRNTALSDQPIEVGDKVVMLYPSANLDEHIFDQPTEFDIERTPNPHVGFGGGGPHFCLGAALARVQIGAVFTQLLTQYPQLTVDDPQYLVSNFMDGIVTMPYHLNR